MGSETLPSACYLPTNLRVVYPFTLRVTGIKIDKEFKHISIKINKIRDTDILYINFID